MAIAQAKEEFIDGIKASFAKIKQDGETIVALYNAAKALKVSTSAAITSTSLLTAEEKTYWGGLFNTRAGEVKSDIQDAIA